METRTKSAVSLLRRLGACSEAIEWIGQRSLAEALAECERADWMLWLLGMMAGEPGWPTRQVVVGLACDCAERALPHFERRHPHDSRPRQCIAVTRRWCAGEATLNEVCDAAAYAADDAADAAAYAADAAAARKTALRELADHIRTVITSVPETA